MKKNTLMICNFLILLLLVSCQKKGSTLADPQKSTKQKIAEAPPSDEPRATLRSYIENVTTADGKIYNATDNTGKTMDCLKIIANPAGGYIGVYHTMISGTFKTNVASSTDLLHWTWIRELAGSNTGGASQPTIAATASGGFVMVWEQEPSNHLKFCYFNSWTDLQNGTVAKTYEAPHTLSTCAEGTPNIYSASSTSVDVGFHYWSNCDVDRQARGTTNWTSWSASAQPQFDNAILYWGVQGNIGDRDVDLDFEGYQFGLIEGQGTKGDFGTWRCYLYDYQTGNADKLSIHTDGGSLAFANPTITALTVDGQPAIVITQFIPSENSANGEAGELIYYKKL